MNHKSITDWFSGRGDSPLLQPTSRGSPPHSSTFRSSLHNFICKMPIHLSKTFLSFLYHTNFPANAAQPQSVSSVNYPFFENFGKYFLIKLNNEQHRWTSHFQLFYKTEQSGFITYWNNQIFRLHMKCGLQHILLIELFGFLVWGNLPIVPSCGHHNVGSKKSVQWSL